MSGLVCVCVDLDRTGEMGYVRGLSSEEILGQVYHGVRIANTLGMPKLDHAVFMGECFHSRCHVYMCVRVCVVCEEHPASASCVSLLVAACMGSHRNGRAVEQHSQRAPGFGSHDRSHLWLQVCENTHHSVNSWAKSEHHEACTRLTGDACE